MKNVDFLTRLQFVLDDRKPHPWGKQIGISSGAVTRIYEHFVPGTEIINAIARYEHVNISWLLEGKGRPYQLSDTSNDQEAANLLRMLLTDEPGAWRVVLLTDPDGNIAVVLLQPGRYQFNKRLIDYHIIELVTGPIGTAALLVLSLERLEEVRVSAEMLAGIQQGQFGTYRLVMAEKAVLNASTPLTGERLNQLLALHARAAVDYDKIDKHSSLIAEVAKKYKTGESARLYNKIQALRPEMRAHLEAIIDGLQN